MAASGDPDSAIEIIAHALEPLLGDNMARAALKVNLEKLGLEGRELSPSDIERLLDELQPGLRVFLGQAHTQRVLDGIRSQFAARGGAA